MLLWPLLLLLLLLLPTLALLRQQRSQDARLSWLAGLQHRVAWGALVWAATWQRWRLEQSTLHVHQSQQQALTWCLQGAQRPHCSLRRSTGSHQSCLKLLGNWLPEVFLLSLGL
ncbi:GHDC isoform 8 [Pongo abelii]|uniref:GHDC isoform 8 n=1 Tax=Pongo abelii TaxID=9601 RepID=A0A2J8RF63_PONAB|nr:GHDC isoform 8 [Pongo abelii]